MNLKPITIREANTFITVNHRHHKAVQGGKFALSVVEASVLVGVAIVGRPVARLQDDGWTVEVTRLCVIDGYFNACSMLYGAAWRTARAMGYKRVITYILESERGASLYASGFRLIGTTKGETWNRPKRPRIDKHPTCPKKIFERT